MFLIFRLRFSVGPLLTSGCSKWAVSSARQARSAIPGEDIQQPPGRRGQVGDAGGEQRGMLAGGGQERGLVHPAALTAAPGGPSRAGSPTSR